MANNYGIANLGTIENEPFLSGDVACPAGVTTVLCSTPALKGTDPSGVYLPFVIVNFQVLLGATPPTAFSISARIGAGANFNGVGWPPVLLVANANITICASFVGTPSIVPWQGAGSVINIVALATGQAVTVKSTTLGWADVFLFRGPDQ